MKNETRTLLLSGAILIGLAIMLGAFGAHGLKNILEQKYLDTFETGVRYHIYHAFGLMILGLVSHALPQIKLRGPGSLMALGIFLFSFNCYLYALTQIKTFAMIVPLGGACFIVSWFLVAWNLAKK